MGLALNPVAFRIGHSRVWTESWCVRRIYYPVFVQKALRVRLFLHCFCFHYFPGLRQDMLYSHFTLKTYKNKFFVVLYIYDGIVMKETLWQFSQQHKRDIWQKLRFKRMWLKREIVDREYVFQRLLYLFRALGITFEKSNFDYREWYWPQWEMEKINKLKNKFGSWWIAREDLWFWYYSTQSTSNGFNMFGLTRLHKIYKYYLFRNLKDKFNSFGEVDFRKYLKMKKTLTKYFFLVSLVIKIMKHNPTFPNQLFTRRFYRLFYKFLLKIWIVRPLFQYLNKVMEFVLFGFDVNAKVITYLLKNSNLNAVFLSRYLMRALFIGYEYKNVLIPTRKTLTRQMFRKKMIMTIKRYKNHYKEVQKELFGWYTWRRDLLFKHVNQYRHAHLIWTVLLLRNVMTKAAVREIGRKKQYNHIFMWSLREDLREIVKKHKKTFTRIFCFYKSFFFDLLTMWLLYDKYTYLPCTEGWTKYSNMYLLSKCNSTDLIRKQTGKKLLIRRGISLDSAQYRNKDWNQKFITKHYFDGWSGMDEYLKKRNNVFFWGKLWDNITDFDIKVPERALKNKNFEEDFVMTKDIENVISTSESWKQFFNVEKYLDEYKFLKNSYLIPAWKKQQINLKQKIKVAKQIKFKRIKQIIYEQRISIEKYKIRKKQIQLYDFIPKWEKNTIEPLQKILKNYRFNIREKKKFFEKLVVYMRKHPNTNMAITKVEEFKCQQRELKMQIKLILYVINSNKQFNIYLNKLFLINNDDFYKLLIEDNIHSNVKKYVELVNLIRLKKQQSKNFSKWLFDIFHCWSQVNWIDWFILFKFIKIIRRYILILMKQKKVLSKKLYVKLAFRDNLVKLKDKYAMQDNKWHRREVKWELQKYVEKQQQRNVELDFNKIRALRRYRHDFNRTLNIYLDSFPKLKNHYWARKKKKKNFLITDNEISRKIDWSKELIIKKNWRKDFKYVRDHRGFNKIYWTILFNPFFLKFFEFSWKKRKLKWSEKHYNSRKKKLMKSVNFLIKQIVDSRNRLKFFENNLSYLKKKTAKYLSNYYVIRYYLRKLKTSIVKWLKYRKKSFFYKFTQMTTTARGYIKFAKELHKLNHLILDIFVWKGKVYLYYININNYNVMLQKKMELFKSFPGVRWCYVDFYFGIINSSRFKFCEYLVNFRKFYIWKQLRLRMTDLPLSFVRPLFVFLFVKVIQNHCMSKVITISIKNYQMSIIRNIVNFYDIFKSSTFIQSFLQTKNQSYMFANIHKYISTLEYYIMDDHKYVFKPFDDYKRVILYNGVNDKLKSIILIWSLGLEYIEGHLGWWETFTWLNEEKLYNKEGIWYDMAYEVKDEYPWLYRMLLHFTDIFLLAARKNRKVQGYVDSLLNNFYSLTSNVIPQKTGRMFPNLNRIHYIFVSQIYFRYNMELYKPFYMDVKRYQKYIYILNKQYHNNRKIRWAPRPRNRVELKQLPHHNKLEKWKEIKRASRKSVLGYKFQFSGRFTRKQKAARWWYQRGANPASSMDCIVDYGFFSTTLLYGRCTFRVWIYRNKKKNPKYRYVIA